MARAPARKWLQRFIGCSFREGLIELASERPAGLPQRQMVVAITNRCAGIAGFVWCLRALVPRLAPAARKAFACSPARGETPSPSFGGQRVGVAWPALRPQPVAHVQGGGPLSCRLLDFADFVSGLLRSARQADRSPRDPHCDKNGSPATRSNKRRRDGAPCLHHGLIAAVFPEASRWKRTARPLGRNHEGEFQCSGG